MIEIVDDPLAAVERVPSGASIAVGGFGLSGSPIELLNALADLDRRDLHLISNNIGSGTEAGMDRLAIEQRIRKFTGSFPGGQPFLTGVYTGRIELEMVPQGTLAERLRAGGSGVAAFYTPTSVGTVIADGGFPTRYDESGTAIEFSAPKESRRFGDREFVLEEAIRPDFGFVKAYAADTKGNLIFRLSARNFNPLVAMAGQHVIVQAEHVVEAGTLDPAAIHLPGIYVDTIVSVPGTTPAPADWNTEVHVHA